MQFPIVNEAVSANSNMLRTSQLSEFCLVRVCDLFQT